MHLAECCEVREISRFSPTKNRKDLVDSQFKARKSWRKDPYFGREQPSIESEVDLSGLASSGNFEPNKLRAAALVGNVETLSAEISFDVWDSLRKLRDFRSKKVEIIRSPVDQAE
ncbi:MAG: hypothetical protein WCK25_01895 [Actinomycetes bacterium]